MSREVAAQFRAALAVILRLPSSEGFRRADGQSGVLAEVVQQPIRRQTAHVGTIPFLHFRKDAGQQSHLRRREWLDFRRNLATLIFDRRLKRRNFRWESSTLGWRMIWI